MTYEIGGKTYEQKPLVLGQWQQLLPLLSGIRIAPELGAVGLVAAFGERLSDALAVVLTEEGQSPKGKDLKALSEELAFSLDTDTTFAVIEDFFVCNPVPSLLAKVAGMMGKVTGSPTSA